jgi:hypothetical protein
MAIMADDVAVPDPEEIWSICFTWGHYFVGRENEGMACFAAAIKYFKDRLDQKKIDRYMVGVAVQGNFTNFAGYLVAEGTPAQITEILNDELETGPPPPEMPTSFQGLVSVARHCIFNFSVVRCDALGASAPPPAPPPKGKAILRRRKKFDATKAFLKF